MSDASIGDLGIKLPCVQIGQTAPHKPFPLWWAIESIGLFLLLSLPQYRDQFPKGNPFYNKNLKYGSLRWFRGPMAPAAKPEDPV